jgi:hypothetical protein
VGGYPGREFSESIARSIFELRGIKRVGVVSQRPKSHPEFTRHREGNLGTIILLDQGQGELDGRGSASAGIERTVLKK